MWAAGLDSPSGSTGYSGGEERGQQRGAAGEALLPPEPVHLPAPQRVRQDPAAGGQCWSVFVRAWQKNGVSHDFSSSAVTIYKTIHENTLMQS